MDRRRGEVHVRPIMSAALTTLVMCGGNYRTSDGGADTALTPDGDVLDSAGDDRTSSIDGNSDGMADGVDAPPQCVPSGQRQPFNTLKSHTASGVCAQGNPCQRDVYFWSNQYQMTFMAKNEDAVCSGAMACVSNVGIDTFEMAGYCQGAWDVYCDSLKVGNISTLGKACNGSAMMNGCSISFAPTVCATIRLVASAVGGGCCNTGSVITAVSAW